MRLTAALGLAVTLAFVGLACLAALWRSGAVPDPGDGDQERDGVSRLPEIPAFLLYALMTLGPGLLVLAGLDASEGAIAPHGRRAGVVRRALVTWAAYRCSITCSSGR